MKIQVLKDLEAVIKLCRKMGVSSISVDGVQLTLGAEPQRKLKTEAKDSVEVEPAYNDEQLLTWSSQEQM